MSEWRQKFGGIRWRQTPLGVEIDGGVMMHTAGEPVTMRRLLLAWGHRLRSVAIIADIPLPLLMMTVMTEGALRWTGGGFDYPPWRMEPGYKSDAETPHRISFGPMHVLLSTYRAALKDPGAQRNEAMILPNNLLAGALYIQQTKHKHGFDPILTAASYNAGGIYDASDPASKYHSRWHIRAYGDHLNRAARWYGDAVIAIAESPQPEPPPNISIPKPQPPEIKQKAA